MCEGGVRKDPPRGMRLHLKLIENVCYLCEHRAHTAKTDAKMADAETNWIDFYISLAPVVQTSIWAGVAVFGTLSFRKPLSKLIDELVHRVTRGDKITTPWLSLSSSELRERTIVDQVTGEINSSIVESNIHADVPLDDIFESTKKRLEEIRERFVTINFSADDFDTKYRKDVNVSLYMTGWSSVSDFLNDVYVAAKTSGVKLPIWSYGQYWEMINSRTKSPIRKQYIGDKIDERQFEVLDIVAGDRLISIRLD